MYVEPAIFSGAISQFFIHLYPIADKSCLLERIRDKVRAKHYSPRTGQAYIQWIKRYILFRNKRHPRDMDAL